MYTGNFSAIPFDDFHNGHAFFTRAQMRLMKAEVTEYG